MDTSYALDNSLYRTCVARSPTPPLMVEFDDIMTVPEDFELELEFALDLFDTRAVPLDSVAEKDRQSIADTYPRLPHAAAAAAATCANVVGWTPTDGRSFIVLDTPDRPAPQHQATTMPLHDYSFLRGPNYLPIGGGPANDYALSAPAAFTSPAWGTLRRGLDTRPQQTTAGDRTVSLCARALPTGAAGRGATVCCAHDDRDTGGARAGAAAGVCGCAGGGCCAEGGEQRGP
ncbi:hypothetical protein A0H81_03334 [Grifola frondosa]|uniref:Uncharacterized protein n=1 Tax=Grifola frondosa TaxID=5627 RepID=A0A1C7MGY3_GRIFR|nr:hypothetical protein A0H81_03334 [Grifola frondosa]